MQSVKKAWNFGKNPAGGKTKGQRNAMPETPAERLH